MDKILLLLSIPGIGLVTAKRFLRKNHLLMEDDDYFYYLLSEYVEGSVSTYIDKVKRVKDNCDRLGVKIIRCTNANIIEAPLLLFTVGDLKHLSSERLLGVVGTREPSPEALKLGRSITKKAVDSGWTIISGLARGCDRLAHRTAVQTEGNTIAVLPCGYRKDIAPWIEERGLLISEYPPLAPVKKYRCVKRNRIITGYSKALYVIETGWRGGSMRSVEYAYRRNVPIAYGFGPERMNRYDAINVTATDDLSIFLS